MTRGILPRLVAACGAGAASLLLCLPRADASPPPLPPPVISEPFTVLPCHPATTLGSEGCAEHDLLAADRRIDQEVRVLFGLLHGDAARARLATAESAWLAYRRADCSSQSDAYAGGSFAPVAFALCEVHDDADRSADLRRFYRALVEGRSRPPAFP
ncbi:MAG: lysozyme inhibitor LprI family protein [Actinomycetota bacterium]|nr:lysozyme inhibitor LprI family protein [Actinomycetota bacterium]